MNKQERELKTKGFTRSFYVTRHDVDFFLALMSMLEDRNTTLSTFTMFCFKYVVLNEGHEVFDDFQEHYKKLIDTRLNELRIKYKGQTMSLDELLDSDLMKEEGFIKI